MTMKYVITFYFLDQFVIKMDMLKLFSNIFLQNYNLHVLSLIEIDNTILNIKIYAGKVAMVKNEKQKRIVKKET